LDVTLPKTALMLKVLHDTINVNKEPSFLRVYRQKCTKTLFNIPSLAFHAQKNSTDTPLVTYKTPSATDLYNCKSV